MYRVQTKVATTATLLGHTSTPTTHVGTQNMEDNPTQHRNHSHYTHVTRIITETNRPLPIVMGQALAPERTSL